MNSKEIILYCHNFINTTTILVDLIVDYYSRNKVDFDSSLKNSLDNLFNSYTLLLPLLPQLITGRLDGRNYRNELESAIQECQIALVYIDDNPMKLSDTWKRFKNLWKIYDNMIKVMLQSNKMIQLSLN